jgi:hypothetical protein
LQPSLRFRKTMQKPAGEGKLKKFRIRNFTLLTGGAACPMCIA